MSVTDQEIREALETCASEPVHVPGTVQPFACMIAAEATTVKATHVSANSSDFLGLTPDQILGIDLRKLLGQDFWHNIINAMSGAESTQQLTYSGSSEINGQKLVGHVFQSQDKVVVELEHDTESTFGGADALKTLRFLMQSVERCETETALFEVSVRLMRNLTGYDRVMIYRFDTQFNGEIMAEDRRRTLQSFLGLRFPHWDIPPQARDIMAKIPLRFIQNVDQTPVPLRAADENGAPLDISAAASRGVSPVHMTYLKNMELSATMTLSIMIEDALWGMISFHHLQPHVPNANLRELLIQFAQVFSTKLQVLRQKSRLALVSRIDVMKDQVIADIEDEMNFDAFVSSVLKIVDADGLSVSLGDRVLTSGLVPAKPLLSDLHKVGWDSKQQLSFENLGEEFPTKRDSLNGCAGAVVVVSRPDRSLCLYRKEIAKDIVWAGNPEKEIETFEGKASLSPRASFSTYLEHARGFSNPWTEQDLYFASRVWTLVNSVERRELVTTMARQQKIMIDELNHRVRNILALVRSVSQQARRSSYGSLESYSRSLEARIQALAASHDLASDIVDVAVPITDLIAKEFEPYLDDSNRVAVTGTGRSLRADIAPIFSLVIHELVTNAVKYGALSNDVGKVSLHLGELDDGIELIWQESGGPPVRVPQDFGFGSTLIKQAVPHELDGEAQLDFQESGVHARLTLPNKVFVAATPVKAGTDTPDFEEPFAMDDVTEILAKATCCVLEDNFVIADGLRYQLEDMGVANVEVFSSSEAALDFINEENPTFAILDVNLGGGKTSEALARELQHRKLPFLFVTGYGDSGGLSVDLRDATRLTKPVISNQLMVAVMKILKLEVAQKT